MRSTYTNPMSSKTVRLAYSAFSLLLLTDASSRKPLFSFENPLPAIALLHPSQKNEADLQRQAQVLCISDALGMHHPIPIRGSSRIKFPLIEYKVKQLFYRHNAVSSREKYIDEGMRTSTFAAFVSQPCTPKSHRPTIGITQVCETD